MSTLSDPAFSIVVNYPHTTNSIIQGLVYAREPSTVESEYKVGFKSGVIDIDYTIDCIEHCLRINMSTKITASKQNNGHQISRRWRCRPVDTNPVRYKRIELSITVDD